MSLIVNYKYIRTEKNIGKLKVVNMSDLHISEKFTFKEKNELVKTISDIKPDIITIPGDCIDSIDVINSSIYTEDIALQTLDDLSKISEVYISLDWHDYLTKSGKHETIGDVDEWISELLLLNNVITFLPDELLNRYGKRHTVYMPRDNVSIFGKSLPYSNSSHLYDNSLNLKIFLLNELKGYINNLNLSEENYNILLYHNPQIFFIVNRLINPMEYGIERVNFINSGHMHNGVLPELLEFIRKLTGDSIGIISPEKSLFPRNTSGLYQNGEFNLDISKGYCKIPETAPLLFKTLKPLYHSDIDVIEIEGNSEKKKIYT